MEQAMRQLITLTIVGGFLLTCSVLAIIDLNTPYKIVIGIAALVIAAMVQCMTDIFFKAVNGDFVTKPYNPNYKPYYKRSYDNNQTYKHVIKPDCDMTAANSAASNE